MASTEFFNQVTEIPADWANDVNTLVYGIFGGAQTVVQVNAALGNGTMAKQNANNVTITGGSIDGVTLGANSACIGTFSAAFLNYTPTTPLHATNKAYVDALFNSSGLSPSYLQANYLQLVGGVLTGPLTLSGPPTNALHATTKNYVDTQVATMVTLTTLQTELAGLASVTYVNGAVAAVSSRKMYHQSTTETSNTGIYNLLVVPVGDPWVFADGAPIPKAGIAVSGQQLIVSPTPLEGSEIELYYYG